MSCESYKYWPFSVLPPEERTEFHSALIALLEAVAAAGHTAYVNETETVLGFGDSGRRAVEYVYRGGRNRYWEPWLTDHGTLVRLGPLFALPESTCVVFDGFTDLATFTMRWLENTPLEDALAGLTIFERTNTGLALRR